MNIFKVFKRQIALELATKGNQIIYTEPNRKKTWLSVFCFEDNDKLHKDFNAISNK